MLSLTNPNLPKIIMNAEQLTERGNKWDIVRDAYLNRAPCPSYKELSEEFGIPHSSVSMMAREENWPQLRLDIQNKALAALGAGEIIAKAITAENQITDTAKQVVIKLLGKLELIIENSPTDEKNRKKSADILNTCSFAIQNCSNSMKALGIVGLPKELKDAGKSGNNQWDKQLLQQINVTVQGLTASETQRKVDIVETAPKVENVQVADTAVNS